jgi:hypothetical protein
LKFDQFGNTLNRGKAVDAALAGKGSWLSSRTRRAIRNREPRAMIGSAKLCVTTLVFASATGLAARAQFRDTSLPQ